MWYVGQKVVCVYDNVIPGEGGSASLGSWFPGEEVHKDQIYTVRSYHTDTRTNHKVFHLFEVERHESLRKKHGEFIGYGVRRFRPLLDKKTDISVFTDILKSVKEPEYV